MIVKCITEDEEKISLHDANSSKERPVLEGFDFDQDNYKEIEVSFIKFTSNSAIEKQRRVLFQCRCG